MATFDFETAWREVADPAWQALPETSRAFVRHVTAVVAGLAQDEETLHVPWPIDSICREHGTTAQALKARFNGDFTERDLAVLAHVAYFHGHWLPGGEAGEGVLWRFSSLADRALTERIYRRLEARHDHLDSPYRLRLGYKSHTGLSMHVSEGFLMANLSCEWSSGNIAVGWATYENVLAVRKAMVRMPPFPDEKKGRRAAEEWIDKAEARIKTVREASMRSDDFARWHDVAARYMVDEAVIKQRSTAKEWPKIKAEWPMDIRQQVEHFVGIGRLWGWDRRAKDLCFQTLLALGIFSGERKALWRDEVRAAFPGVVLGGGWARFWCSLTPEALDKCSPDDESDTASP